MIGKVARIFVIRVSRWQMSQRLKFGWLLVPAVLVFWRLGASPLYFDEAIYAEVAKQSAKGHWLTLYWNGVPWLEKPPLFIWLTALAFKVFGVSELTARSVSALSGLGVVVVSYITAKRLYGVAAGVIAGTILLTSQLFVFFSRFGTTDVLLTFFTILGIYFFLRTAEDSRYWFGVGLAIACAVLTKGAAAYIGPLSVGIGLVAERRTRTTIRDKHFWTALILALALVTSWHVAQYVLHGRNFVNTYIGLHLLQRSASGEVFGGAQGWSFYLLVLWRGLMPWFLLFPVALVLIRDRRAIVLVACSVITVAIFSTSSTKFPWYVLPAIPAIAILIGGMLVRLLLPNRRKLLISAVVVFAGVGFLKLLPTIFSGPIDVPPVERLARLASKDSGVLITAPEQIQDTVIYYSDRKVCTEATLNPLSYGYIQPCRLDEPRHVIFTQRMGEKVGLLYKIRVLSEDGGVIYAEILR